MGREAGDEGREVGRNLGVLTVDRAGGEKRQAEHQLCLGRQSWCVGLLHPRQLQALRRALLDMQSKGLGLGLGVEVRSGGGVGARVGSLRFPRATDGTLGCVILVGHQTRRVPQPAVEGPTLRGSWLARSRCTPCRPQGATRCSGPATRSAACVDRSATCVAFVCSEADSWVATQRLRGFGTALETTTVMQITNRPTTI